MSKVLRGRGFLTKKEHERRVLLKKIEEIDKKIADLEAERKKIKEERDKTWEELKKLMEKYGLRTLPILPREYEKYPGLWETYRKYRRLDDRFDVLSTRIIGLETEKDELLGIREPEEET